MARHDWSGPLGVSRCAARIAVELHELMGGFAHRLDVGMRAARAVLELNEVRPPESMDSLVANALLDIELAPLERDEIRERLENELAVAIARATRRS